MTSIHERYDLVVADMAGTTMRDGGEIEDCFIAAAKQHGIQADRPRVLSMMGWSKRLVFETLYADQTKGEAAKDSKIVDDAYATFRELLERHYREQPVEPTDGAVECIRELRAAGVKVALTTGFYRVVTDIILDRLGWDRGLDGQRISTGESFVDASITSDEVASGRPAPDMIQRAMTLLKVTDPARVVKIGDTPSDLQAGKNAGCALNLGLTNGSHSEAQLATEPNDALLANIGELVPWLENH